MIKDILEFRNEHYYLSNFYNAPIRYNGLTFKNNEAAFQAMKCPERASEFCDLNGADAKRLGRCVRLRSDWATVKERIMYEICLAKFMQNDELKRRLLATGDALLVEGNSWNDREWGVCNGVGENKLGKILMRVRNELKGANRYD